MLSDYLHEHLLQVTGQNFAASSKEQLMYWHQSIVSKHNVPFELNPTFVKSKVMEGNVHKIKISTNQVIYYRKPKYLHQCRHRQ